MRVAALSGSLRATVRSWIETVDVDPESVSRRAEETRNPALPALACPNGRVGQTLQQRLNAYGLLYKDLVENRLGFAFVQSGGGRELLQDHCALDQGNDCGHEVPAKTISAATD
jgi:hypothetical protein